MVPKEVIKEIRHFTSELISSGLAIDQNPPSLRNVYGCEVIGISDKKDLSSTLRDVAYAETYAALREDRIYNVLLVDGGILQLLYTFEGGAIIKHRLSFYPSPNLLEYQNSSDIYDNDEIFGDIVHKGVVTSPLRFDYDPSAHVDVEHPQSHLTIGQYKNCRIPVSGPLAPAVFMAFILRAFYNTPFKNFLSTMTLPSTSFVATITASERGIAHLAIHG